MVVMVVVSITHGRKLLLSLSPSSPSNTQMLGFQAKNRLLNRKHVEDTLGMFEFILSQSTHLLYVKDARGSNAKGLSARARVTFVQNPLAVTHINDQCNHDDDKHFFTRSSYNR